MKTTRRTTSLILLFVTSLAAAFDSSGQAASIPVGNSSFENPVYADGAYSSGPVPGWTQSAGATTGIQNPVDAQFTGATAPGTGMPDGSQCGYLNSAGSLSQTVAATLQANTAYALRVAAGDRKDMTVGTYAVQLRAGGQVLGTASPTTVNDGWVVATVQYRALPGDPLLGQPLEIVLSKAKTVFGEQVDFDHVTLESTPVEAMPPEVGLRAHWKFDESSGSVARDVTGRHDGQLTAAGASFVTGGVAGGALQLDRALNGMVQVPHIPEIATNDFSVVAWAKLPPGDVTASTFLFSQHEAWYDNGCLLLLNTSPGWGAPGKASFVVENGHTTVTSTTSINDGQWHQIVGVYARQGQMAIYVDGVPAEATRASVPLTERGAPLLIGGLYGNDVTSVPKGYYSGWVDDVQVYSKALNDAQIDLLFRNPGKNLADLNGPLTITPNGGEFLDSITVTLSSGVPTATIRYTLDGSDPVTTSTAYQTPITLHDTTTLKARLFVNSFPASEVYSATFTKLPSIGFVPAAGLFTNAVDVTIVNRLGVGSLFYTTDNSDPTSASTPYTTPIRLTAAATIKARVLFNGFPISEIVSASYARVYAFADDGIPKEWREKFFGPGYATDPRAAADADPDGDGWTNQFEYGASTDPTDKNSAPIVAGIRAIPLVTWSSVPGLTYAVLRKETVSQPDWDVVVPAFKATESTSTYIDTGAPWTAIYLIKLAP